MKKQNGKERAGSRPKKNKEFTGKSIENIKSERLPPGDFRNDSYKQYMKYLIATNADYFQSKIRVTNNGRPQDFRFKIPCHTGMTIYKKDYKQKQLKYFPERTMTHDMSVDCIKTNNFMKEEKPQLKFDGKTMYQKEFKFHLVKGESSRKFKKRVETATDDADVPRFFDTQNRTDFLNWAGKNYVPSMKPQHKSVVTNVPFQATSIYKTDFDGKPGVPTPIFVRESSFPKFGNISMVMRSNYSNEFSKKIGNNIEIDCKPKHYDANLCKQFKGKTEYKRQFIKQKAVQQQNSMPKTLQDLQTLIIDL